MKKTNDAKKLSLNKQTVRALDQDQLDLAVGGRTTFVSCTCPKTQGLDCTFTL
jgi:hypothetical protein